MTKPIISHTIRRIQVIPFSPAISPSETMIPIIGTNGTHGVRKGRFSSGRLTRRIQTAEHTITNARSVPMLTI